MDYFFLQNVIKTQFTIGNMAIDGSLGYTGRFVYFKCFLSDLFITSQQCIAILITTVIPIFILSYCFPSQIKLQNFTNFYIVPITIYKFTPSINYKLVIIFVFLYYGHIVQITVAFQGLSFLLKFLSCQLGREMNCFFITNSIQDFF